MVRIPPPLDEIRPRLEQAFGPRLRGVMLFGSRARGDHQPDSDLDLMLLLEGPLELYLDIRTAVQALSPVQNRIDYGIQTLPVDVKAFEAQDRLLYREAKRDGIVL